MLNSTSYGAVPVAASALGLPEEWGCPTSLVGGTDLPLTRQMRLVLVSAIAGAERLGAQLGGGGLHAAPRRPIIRRPPSDTPPPLGSAGSSWGMVSLGGAGDRRGISGWAPVAAPSTRPKWRAFLANSGPLEDGRLDLRIATATGGEVFVAVVHHRDDHCVHLPREFDVPGPDSRAAATSARER